MELENTWAVVDIMGHRRLIGQCSEDTICGEPVIRVDVPEHGDETVTKQGFTEFVKPSALYALKPVSEEIARAMLPRLAPLPVSSYELTEAMNVIMEKRMRQEQQRLSAPEEDAEDDRDTSDEPPC